jgi:hypothetical protein
LGCTYLIEKFVAQNCLFGYTKSDVPSKADIDGPKALVQRLKRIHWTPFGLFPLIVLHVVRWVMSFVKYSLYLLAKF